MSEPTLESATALYRLGVDTLAQVGQVADDPDLDATDLSMVMVTQVRMAESLFSGARAAAAIATATAEAAARRDMVRPSDRLL